MLQVKLSEHFAEINLSKRQRMIKTAKMAAKAFIRATIINIVGVRAKGEPMGKFEAKKSKFIRPLTFNEWASEFGVSTKVPIKFEVTREQIANKFGILTEQLLIN